MINKNTWLNWLLLAILCLAVYAIINGNTDILDYNREMILDGEYWRLITGNFNHTNIYHLLLNIAGLTVIAGLHHTYFSSKAFISLIVYLSITIGLCILWLSPETLLYVGLSGVLHGLLIVGAIIDVGKKHYSGYLLIIGVIGKVVSEQLFQSPTQVSELIEATVLTEAHLYGLIAGIVISPVYVYLALKKSA
jgi:rhomboid family GlyGly-CTERM serine protease